MSFGGAQSSQEDRNNRAKCQTTNVGKSNVIFQIAILMSRHHTQHATQEPDLLNILRILSPIL